MGKKDPRIDAYIDKAVPLGKPVLVHIRAVIHEACPDVEETIKWSFPHFMYKGILCSMAAFKEHCALHIWKGSTIVDDASRGAMGQFGRITDIDDLPSRAELTRYIKKAMQLRDDGVQSPTPKKRRVAKPVEVPKELSAALRKNRKAAAAFESFPPSHRREYSQWIAEAKREETRRRRVETALEWIAEGKSRNWKYERPRS